MIYPLPEAAPSSVTNRAEVLNDPVQGRLQPPEQPAAGPTVEPEERFTTSEKGKSRADSDETMTNGDEGEDAEGRGKRVKKKRRLSASDEVDPNTLGWDGTPLKKPRGRPRVAAPILPFNGPLRPEDVKLTYLDVKSEAELAENTARPPLADPRDFSPMWADRPHAFTAAAGRFQSPIKTMGAWVARAANGQAQGVILTGQPETSVGGNLFRQNYHDACFVTSMWVIVRSC